MDIHSLQHDETFVVPPNPCQIYRSEIEIIEELIEMKVRKEKEEKSNLNAIRVFFLDNALD